MTRSFLLLSLLVPALALARVPPPKLVVVVNPDGALSQVDSATIGVHLYQVEEAVEYVRRNAAMPMLHRQLERASSNLAAVKGLMGISVRRQGNSPVSLTADPMRPNQLLAAVSSDLVVVQFRALDSELGQLERSLEMAMNMVGRMRDYDRRLMMAVRAVQLSREQLGGRLLPPEPVPPVPAPMPPPPGEARRPMPEPRFADMLGMMEKETRHRDRLRILEQATSHQLLLVNQIEQVLARFGNQDVNKLLAMRLMADRVFDKVNAFKLYASFRSSADKDLVKLLLETPRPSEVVLQPISPEGLRELLTVLEKAFGPTRSMEALERAAPNHLFTSAQVSEIVERGFRYSPSSQLKAIRVLRPRLLDPENEAPLRKLFEMSNSNTKELIAILSD